VNRKDVERRLSTILAADVVGYSRLVGLDEAGTVSAIKAQLAELIEPKAVQYRGRIVKLMGDGLLMEFVSVVEAVLFAVEMQGALAGRNDGVDEDRRIVYRIGINIGDIIVDGEDIHGDGVNIASRLESIAEPGGIYISDAAFSQVRGKLDLNFENLGEHEVKNIAQPVTVCRVVMDDKASSQVTGIKQVRKRRMPVPALVAVTITALIVAGGLGWWLVGAGGPASVHHAKAALVLPEKPSVVILPLKNLSEASAQSSLSDAISEDITTELSRFAGLFVISADSAKFYEDRQRSPKEIGRELGVRYVLTGSIRRAADRLRVTMQLIEAESEKQIWTEKYDRTVTDVFVVQDEIVRSVVTTLGEKIWRSAAGKLASKPLKNFASYDYMLQGIDVFHKLTAEANEEARRLFLKAIELEPEFGMPYYGLAWTHYIEFRAQWVNTGPEALDKAAAILEQASDRQVPGDKVHRLLAKISQARGEYDKAVSHNVRALELNPNDGDLLAAQAQMLTSAGQLDEARRWIDDAMRRNPHYPGWYASTLSAIQYLQKDYEGALATLNKADQLAIWDRRYLAASYAQLGRQEEAQKQVRTVLDKDPKFSIGKFESKISLRRKSDKTHFIEGLKEAGFPD
jgi:TolB-like protein/class 3 adenylate cyclase